MSRRTTPRRKAARRMEKARQQDGEISRTLAEWKNARAPLAALAAVNLAERRGRVTGKFAAVRAEKNAQPVPAAFTRPVPKPAPAAPVKAPPAPRVHVAVKAAELPAEIRAVTRKHLADGDLSGEWFRVGILDKPDDLTVDVYARKHGASVRYSVAA